MSVEALANESYAPGTLRSKAIRGGSIYLVSRLAVQFFQWFITLFVARLLAPADFGLMATAMIFVGLADLLAEAGLASALVHKKDVTPADKKQAFTVSILLSIGLYCLVWSLASPVAVQLGNLGFATLLRVVALGLFLVPLRAMGAAHLTRDLQLGRQSVVFTLVAAVQSGLVLALALAGYGVWSLAWGMLLGRLIEALVLWYFSGWRPALAWPSSAGKCLLGYGLTISLTSLVWFVYRSADLAVVSALLGPIMLGYYSIAFQLISLPVEKLTANINQVAFTTYCKLQDDRVRMRRWFSRQVVLLSLIAMPTLTGLALVADVAIPLILGAKWREAVLPVRVLAPIGALMVVGSSLSPLFNALGRPDIGLKYNLVCVTVFPAAFLAAGFNGGLLGVCLAWLVIHPVLVAGLIHFTRSITGITLYEVLRMHAPILAGVLWMCIIVPLVRYVVPGDEASFLHLSAAVLSGAAVYTGWIFVVARETVIADVVTLLRELRGRKNGRGELAI
jgi:teichuronic acid exporter